MWTGLKVDMCTGYVDSGQGNSKADLLFRIGLALLQPVPKLAPPNPPQKRGPVNSQYVVLFTQRMIKVP